MLFNELNNKTCYMLKRLEDGTFDLTEKNGDSNQSFSYHLYLKQTLEEAIAADKIERYHFTLLRNLYEKTSNFLGYPQWSELLPGDQQLYLNRIIQFTSHSTLSSEAIAEPSPQEKADSEAAAGSSAQQLRLLAGGGAECLSRRPRSPRSNHFIVLDKYTAWEVG